MFKAQVPITPLPPLPPRNLMMPLTMGNLRATICEFGPPSLIDQIGCKEKEDGLGGEGGTCRVECGDLYSLQITSLF
jgi:hypothetical protein